MHAKRTIYKSTFFSSRFCCQLSGILLCNSPPLFPKHFCCWCRGWRLLQHNAASSNYGSNSSEYLLQQNPEAQIEKLQWKIITCGKSWNFPVFSEKTSVELASPSFWLPSVQALFVFYKLFFPRAKELKIKQKKRCWQGILHPCKPHTESSHKLELQANPLIYIYTTAPTFSSSILPLLPCPIRAPSRRGSEQQQQQAPCSCTGSTSAAAWHRGPNLSLLFPKAKGRAIKGIQRPFIVTSFSIPKECHSQNSTQKLGSGGQEVGARSESKWPAE